MMPQYPSSEPQRVLLVDDDEDAYILTRDMIREFDDQKYVLDWLPGYDTALLVMARNEHVLCLVDYQLGTRNGLELIQDAREQGCTAPIICITGMENHYVDISAMSAGAADYLVKGEITPRMLERSIRYAREHHRDLEALRQSAEELQLLNAQLKNTGKELQELNASKDKFFSIIAHDLRSPFVSLLGFAELLHEGSGTMDRAEISVCARNVYTSAKNLYGLLENLLQWSRIQIGRLVLRPANHDAHGTATQVCALFGGNASAKNITLSNHIPHDSFAFCDPQMLSTVIENLVSNAIKFTPRGGTVGISADDRDGSIAIEVRDTGVGIAESHLRDLFRIDRQHLTRGTEDEQGTGLGLILCKELVEKSGGILEVESEVGGGSVFRIILPRIYRVQQPGSSRTSLADIPATA